MRRGPFEGQIRRFEEDVSKLDSMDKLKQSGRPLIFLLCIVCSIIVMQLIFAQRLQETTASLTRR